MKSAMLKIILKWLTVKIINKYRPYIIAITGSVGKTSTKDAIYLTIGKYRNVRKSNKNFNTETGAPLVFLGAKEAGQDFKSWFLIIWQGFKLILRKDKNYPEVIIVEMAADQKGDIDYLTSFIKPSIGIVTAIGETPVHLENYSNVDAIVKEKSLLVKNTKKGGKVLLNADDGRVFQMKGRAKAKTVTFGFSKRAELRASDIKFTGNKKNPAGLKFKFSHQTEEHMVQLPNVFDKGTVYSVLAAFGAGIVLGIPIYRMVESCKKIVPPKGRMRLIKDKKYLIIDSSYNAAPESTKMALRTLEALPAKRKVAVLGDMLELGDASKEAHNKIGELTGFLDLLITVGNASNEIGKSFRGEYFHFNNAEEAANKISKLLKKDDLILVKGSQSIRTEKIIEKIIKGDPRKLLVRQNYPWKKNEHN